MLLGDYRGKWMQQIQSMVLQLLLVSRDLLKAQDIYECVIFQYAYTSTKLTPNR